MRLREFGSSPARALSHRDRTHFALGRTRRAQAQHDGPLVGYERAHDDGRGYGSVAGPASEFASGRGPGVEPTP